MKKMLGYLVMGWLAVGMMTAAMAVPLPAPPALVQPPGLLMAPDSRSIVTPPDMKLVGVGGALGSIGRYTVIYVMNVWDLVDNFPLGTLTVNVLGSFAIGVVSAAAGPWGLSADMQRMLTVGVLGGFTTFSSFSLDAVQLFQEGHWLLGGTYIMGSVALSIGAVLLGQAAVQPLLGGG